MLYILIAKHEKLSNDVRISICPFVALQSNSLLLNDAKRILDELNFFLFSSCSFSFLPIHFSFWLICYHLNGNSSVLFLFFFFKTDFFPGFPLLIVLISLVYFGYSFYCLFYYSDFYNALCSLLFFISFHRLFSLCFPLLCCCCCRKSVVRILFVL